MKAYVEEFNYSKSQQLLYLTSHFITLHMCHITEFKAALLSFEIKPESHKNILIYKKNTESTTTTKEIIKYTMI